MCKKRNVIFTFSLSSSGQSITINVTLFSTAICQKLSQVEAVGAIAAIKTFLPLLLLIEVYSYKMSKKSFFLHLYNFLSSESNVYISTYPCIFQHRKPRQYLHPEFQSHIGRLLLHRRQR